MFGWKDQRIKVHCVTSCLCEVVKRYSEIDYRPFYFGIWDEPFGVLEQELRYYDPAFTHERLMNNFEQLFGGTVTRWHKAERSAEDNAKRLIELVEHGREGQHVIVQVDLSLIPERENEFKLSPFPHYVLISAGEKREEWYMLDADLKWEGALSRERVLDAFIRNPYPDGLLVDATSLRVPSIEQVTAAFARTHHPESNPLVTRLRGLLAHYAVAPERLPRLVDALQHLHVIVIRKYSYDYALMYFHDQMKLDPDHYEQWAQRIRDLVQAFTTFQYRTVKLALTGRIELLPSLEEQLDRVEALEKSLKLELKRLLDGWLAEQHQQKEASVHEALQ
ncbi:DUF6005 family protein [Paenibacillus sp. YYML68]|uniref:DUF6005 family protein n=1 Tax=Paenibacillus sp. YYML68 TaxID=2909250 RepID=UPI00249370AF|nr:DUF6005 family protein [Paenibacillus sp. YYML68]